MYTVYMENYFCCQGVSARVRVCFYIYLTAKARFLIKTVLSLTHHSNMKHSLKVVKRVKKNLSTCVCHTNNTKFITFPDNMLSHKRMDLLHFRNDNNRVSLRIFFQLDNRESCAVRQLNKIKVLQTFH